MRLIASSLEAGISLFWKQSLFPLVCVLYKSLERMPAIHEGRPEEEGVLRLSIEKDEARIVEVAAAYAGREGNDTLWAADGEAAMSLL